MINFNKLLWFVFVFPSYNIIIKYMLYENTQQHALIFFKFSSFFPPKKIFLGGLYHNINLFPHKLIQYNFALKTCDVFGAEKMIFPVLVTN